MWQDIEGFEELYKVSDKGEIMSVITGKILRGSKTTRYKRPFVTLYKNKIPRVCYTHKLVAETFLPNPNNYYYIKHLDGDISNNSIENLEWSEHRRTRCTA